jgi:diphthamide synthase (EF-2-diphthine--ammonia ligase)
MKAAISWSAGKDACLALLRGRTRPGRAHLRDGDWLEPVCGRAGLEAVFPLEDGAFRSFVWNAPGFAAPLRLARGTVRRVASVPPLAPTALVLR